VADVKELMSTPVGVVRDPGFFKKVKGVNVITGTRATGIDRTAKRVTLVDTQSGKTTTIEYDRLILSMGSMPVVPPFKNITLQNIFTVKGIEDARTLKEKAAAGKRVFIVGAGLIGIEIAEALAMKGLHVTLAEMKEQILPGILDPEIAMLVVKHLREKGVEVLTSCKVEGFTGAAMVEKVLTDHGEAPADLVVLAIGVSPNTAMARDAGLEIGATRAIAVDEHMRTSDPAIFACGDCCESAHIVSGQKVYLPLGSTANKQGRVAGINAAGGEAVFAGVLGTTILRVFDINVGKTGLTETAARSYGYEVETVLSPAPDRAHFFPGAKPITLKLVADKKTGKVLGVQATGPGAVDKRIDTAVAAITFGATAEQLSQLDLAYAPPFASAMDNLVVAADILKNKLCGEAKGISPLEVRKKTKRGEDFLFLDVRSPGEHAEVRITGTQLVPLGMLRERLQELPRDKEIIAFCKMSLRGYEAQKILEAAGFSDVKFMDGGVLAWPYELEQ